VRNEEVLQRVKEEKKSYKQSTKGRANWFGHIFRMTCLLNHVTEGKIEGRIEVTGRR